METLADFLGLKGTSTEGDANAPEPDRWPPRAARLSIRDRARAILESPEYFQSVLHRIRLGTLPPAVELRFYDYAHGKPVERIEVKDTTDDVDEMSPQELEHEAERLLDLARQLRMAEPDAQSAVH